LKFGEAFRQSLLHTSAELHEELPCSLSPDPVVCYQHNVAFCTMRAKEFQAKKSINVS